jgi:hypothetical protein
MMDYIDMEDREETPATRTRDRDAMRCLLGDAKPENKVK